MSSQTFLSDRPLSLGELLDATFRLYRRHFKTLILTAGALLVPLQILTAIALSVMIRYKAIDAPISRKIPFVTLPQIAPDPAASNLAAVGGVGVVAGLIIGLVNILVVVALFWLSIQLLHQQEYSFTEAWRAAKKYFGAYFLMRILQGLVVGLPTSIVAAVLMMMTGAGMIVMAIVLLFGAYMSIRWFVAPVALVDRDMGPGSALGHSWRTTGPHFWRVAIYAALLFLLNIVFVSVPNYGLQMAIIQLTPAHFYNVAMPLISGISSILTAIWQPIYIIAIVMLYFNLKAGQPGDGLIGRLEEMESQEAPSRQASPVSEEEALEKYMQQVEDDLASTGDDV